MNIGEEIEKKLLRAGISSAAELKDIGSENAFLRLKAYYPNVCLVHLYTLQGAIDNIQYNQLPDETKKKLKEFNDRYK